MHCEVLAYSGGFPCQDVSMLNRFRAGAEGARSGLFREFVRVADLAETLAAEHGLRFMGLGECTLMDLHDKELITSEIGWQVVELCAGGSSCVRRPRNYWLDPPVSSQPGFVVEEAVGGSKGVLFGPCEPPEAWVLPGWSWYGGSDESLRLPTFTRAIPRRRPPPGAPGLHRVDQPTLDRYFGDELRFPPYTYQSQFCMFPSSPGDESMAHLVAGRVAVAGEREVLMGYAPGHTAPATKLGGPGGLKLLRDDDTIRCAQVGNSFHTLSVAVLFGAQLEKLGYVTCYRSPQALQEEFIEELLSGANQASAWLADELEAAGIMVEPAGHVCHDSIRDDGDSDVEDFRGALGPPGLALGDGADLARPRGLAQWLAEGHVRATEPRGGDVRVDLALPMRPRAGHRVSIDTRRWTWRHVLSSRVRRSARKAHINQLEMRAVLLSLDWRLRAGQRKRRFVHLVDSQVSLAILCKGRTSSRKLLPEARRIAARVLAAGLTPCYAYVRSKLNPADAPSRIK